MYCSFSERADWVAEAGFQRYGFMIVVVVGIVWGCVREGVVECLF